MDGQSGWRVEYARRVSVALDRVLASAAVCLPGSALAIRLHPALVGGVYAVVCVIDGATPPVTDAVAIVGPHGEDVLEACERLAERCEAEARDPNFSDDEDEDGGDLTKGEDHGWDTWDYGY